MTEVRNYHVVKCWKTDIHQLRKLPLEELVQYCIENGDHYCVTFDVKSRIFSEKLIAGIEEMEEKSRNDTYLLISPDPDPDPDQEV